MNLEKLAGEEYSKGIRLKVLRLAGKIIEERAYKLDKSLNTIYPSLSEEMRMKLENEPKNLLRIAGILRSGSSADELDAGSESIIKRAISEAARRLRPMDQKGMLEALQPKKEEKSHSEKEFTRSELLSKMSEEKIDELLHSGKMYEAQDKILGILNGLLGEIHKIRTSAEAVPKELHEIRMLFARVERQGRFK